MTYDRSDAREARRNGLAIELAEVRRKLGPRSRESELREAARPIAATLALLLAAPVAVHVAAVGPRNAWDGVKRGLREVALSTSLGRDALNDPAEISEASETITMGPARIAVDGTDPNGDPLAIVIVRHPVSGTLTELGGRPILERLAAGERELMYVPDPGFAGEDDFEVALYDGITLSAAATRRVRVYEPPPPPTSPPPSPRTTVDREVFHPGRRVPNWEVTGEFLQRQEMLLEQSNRSAVSAPAERSLMPDLVTNSDLETRR